MRFYHKLYLGKQIKHVNVVKWKLKHNAGQLNIYIISIPDNSGQLEIMHSAFLQQKHLRKHPMLIIGLANGYNEAIQVVTQIVEEVVHNTGTANIKSYLMDKFET